MNQNNRYTKAEIRSQIKEKKRLKALAVQRNITVFALLIMLILGLVSTTFSAFVTENTGDNGSLVAEIQTLAVNQGNKVQIADTKANVDVADTSAITFTSDDVLFFNMKGESWWETSSDGGGNYAYFFNNDTGKNAWSAKAVQYSGDIYYVKIPAGTWAGVILTRNSVTSGPTWDNKWNQTGDIVLSSTSNYISDFANGSTNVTWGTQKPTSAGKLTASPSSVEVNTGVTLAPSLTTYTTYNEIKSTTYSISPSTGASISGNTFTATTAGTYTVTATITYNPRGYSSLTSTLTAETTITVTNPTCTYTVSAATGGKITVGSTTSTSVSGTSTIGTGISIKATPNTGYSFAGWIDVTNGTVASATSATTTFTPSANGAKVKASFKPDDPESLLLSGSPINKGTGTYSSPFITKINSGFTLTASFAYSDTAPSDAAEHFSTDANGTYTENNSFTPSIAAAGVKYSYTVYGKYYTDGIYSDGYASKTAYYMAFTEFDGANTGFSVSSYEITDADTLTLSDAYVNGVQDTELSYITQTYQVSTDNVTFVDITGNTWTPDSVGEYYFRVETSNPTLGRTVVSDSKKVTVIQSTVYYSITVVNDGTVDGTVTLKTDGTTITDGQILSNSPLTVSIARPNSNYYIEYLEVDTLTEFDNENVNGDITDYVAYDHVKGNVVIHYKLTEKPKVTVSKPDNSSAIQFAYYVDGVVTYATVAGRYHVDYDTRISYSVTPNTGYYVKSMTGVTIGEITASTVVGAKNNVIADVASVTATLVNNNTVTVKVDDTSAVTEGGSMTIEGTAHAFDTPKALNYGTESEIVITPPDGYYAVVNDSDITPTISTDGKATFKVKLIGNNKTYIVKFVENPKVYMVQPQYGSVYVTDSLGNYYFNGDPVGYGTELIVNVKPDHANCELADVVVNDVSIGDTDGSKFNIIDDSTVTATITVSDDFAFDETDHTAYGTRRIFFTDTCGWGNSNTNNVLVHCSNTSGDTDFTKNNVTMTRKYYNEYSQYVYYADIPFTTKYVTFVNASNTAQYSTQGTIANSNNAYYMGNTGNYPRAVATWQYVYSDYIATDRVDSIQQAVTSKGDAVTFQYTCDFGDDVLSAEVVSGNDATFDFDKGTLSITPTDNEHNHTLVKVMSSASTTVKYYLIRVESFEIYSVTGLQKIYKANVLNNIQLDLILKGGILNYAADFFISDTNATDSYSKLEISESSGFEKLDSIEGYINSFLFKYALSGVKYFRVDASDGAGHKATAYMNTLFGTNTYNGERALYFYNHTNVNISKYNLRACFKNASGEYVWATMQPVANTNYYRAVIPEDYSSEVDFFLTSKKTFTYNRDDIINANGNLNTEFCSFGVVDVAVPAVDAANIVYAVSSINTNGGINGEFAEFDY